jgi:hypothetical protein
MMRMQTVLMVSLISALGVVMVGSFVLPALLEQAFAPSGRRGFYCDYRLDVVGMTERWAPYTNMYMA